MGATCPPAALTLDQQAGLETGRALDFQCPTGDRGRLRACGSQGRALLVHSVELSPARDRLEVGTETSPDRSKSVKSYLMPLFTAVGNNSVLVGILGS